MKKIDKLDLKILKELDTNARKSNSQIAKKLKTSQQVISYRIQSLIKRKIISQFHTVINFTKLGYTSYKTLTRLSNITPQKQKEIIQYLMNHTNVLWLIECGSRWDLLIDFLAKDIIEFDKILKEFKKKFPEQIQNYDILTMIAGIGMNREYLYDKKQKNRDDFFFGKNNEQVNLDNTNLKILSILSKNARISSLEIAQKLNLSANTIINRIKDMEKNKIIINYRPTIHIEEIGHQAYKAIIKFQNITEEKERTFITYCFTKKNIISIIKQVGAWDVEVEIEVEKKEKMLEITRDIRDKFKDIIKDFDILPLYHEYKYDYFPGDIMS